MNELRAPSSLERPWRWKNPAELSEGGRGGARAGAAQLVLGEITSPEHRITHCADLGDFRQVPKAAGDSGMCSRALQEQLQLQSFAQEFAGDGAKPSPAFPSAVGTVFVFPESLTEVAVKSE